MILYTSELISPLLGRYSTATEEDGMGKGAEPLVDPIATHTLIRSK